MMQPSELEIQREVEALRDLRRRSTTQGGPGSLVLDPDLPSSSSTSSSNTGYWSSVSSSTDGDSSSSHDSSSDHSAVANDPFHLFWVPASVHPEIAPAEFRAFLKEHARTLPPDGSPPERSNSLASISSGLGRKKSMLSRQYRPSENDEPDEENVVPFRRNRTSVYGSPGPQLTISDLQKLEELAEEASASDDPTKLRSVLRRSLSLNVAPSFIDNTDNFPDTGDDVDSPIIIPRSGQQVLRRSARTKIRKPGLPGDGNGHRFASRRGPGRSATLPSQAPAEPRTSTSSDISSNDHESTEGAIARPRAFSNESLKGMGERPESFSEESSIYDSYMREDAEEDENTSQNVVVSPPVSAVKPPPGISPAQEVLPQAQTTPVQQLIAKQPQEVALLSPIGQNSVPSARTPSPEPTPASAIIDNALRARSAGNEVNVPISPKSSPPSMQRKEKDKKGLFGKWGSDKGGKKSGKDKERENRERFEKEKEKDSGFFGSLFGGKKKQDEPLSQTLGHGVNGREAAAALLGASSKAQSRSTSPGVGAPPNYYSRYPIHVERAIYRLSHIKLANPRRPLYEQVLISNLMFWYLGVINKAQNPPASPTQTGTAAGATASAPINQDEEHKEKENEAHLPVEKEHLEEEEEQRAMDQRKESSRKGSLTKMPSIGSLANPRRTAEMPIKGPQYDVQHRSMEQEYVTGHNAATPVGQSHGGPATPAMGRPASAPAGNGGVQIHQPQPQAVPTNNFYYGASNSVENIDQVYNYAPRLPPGAMPPVSVEQNTWMASRVPSSSPPRNHSSPSPPPRASPPATGYGDPRRSRSPPPPMNNMTPNRYGPPSPHEKYVQSAVGGRPPARSLSAAAAAPMPHSQLNGRLRKGNSAHAVVPNASPKRPQANGEEEDVPLAVWQQQRLR